MRTQGTIRLVLQGCEKDRSENENLKNKQEWVPFENLRQVMLTNRHVVQVSNGRCLHNGSFRTHPARGSEC